MSFGGCLTLAQRLQQEAEKRTYAVALGAHLVTLHLVHINATLTIPVTVRNAAVIRCQMGDLSIIVILASQQAAILKVLRFA